MSSKHPISDNIKCATGYMSLEFTEEVRDESEHCRDFNI